MLDGRRSKVLGATSAAQSLLVLVVWKHVIFVPTVDPAIEIDHIRIEHSDTAARNL
jgi:hypothetical protein